MIEYLKPRRCGHSFRKGLVNACDPGKYLYQPFLKLNCFRNSSLEDLWGNLFKEIWGRFPHRGERS